MKVNPGFRRCPLNSGVPKERFHCYCTGVVEPLLCYTAGSVNKSNTVSEQNTPVIFSTAHTITLMMSLQF